MSSFEKILFGIIAIMIFSVTAKSAELTAELEFESQVFTAEALTKTPDQLNGSTALSFEYYYDRYKSGDMFVLSPFLRVDLNDSERNHFDLREFYWQKNIDNIELSIGFRRVFWGVTESVHLIDIINQTDQIENIDGEDKLGQPMVTSSWTINNGTLSLYWLPYFRERTFPGTDGRLRPSVPIDNDNASFESSAEEWHQDWAVRWTGTFGQADYGLAYFEGTERQPDIQPVVLNDSTLSLRPFYYQTKRMSLDLLLVSGGWLLKSEMLMAERYDLWSFASVTGFEYTIVGIGGSRYDLGLLAEYLYDERGRTFTPFENDLFLGGRLAFNDVSGTSLLVGAITDTDNGSIVTVVELERRLSDWWSIEIESRMFIDQKQSDFLYDLRKDDYLQLVLTRYF